MDSIIHQGLKNGEYEVICIDDCSKDCSRQILDEYASIIDEVCCIYNSYNLKTSNSLNRALDAARGKYIWVIGQDDIIEPNRIIIMLFNSFE